MNCCGCTFEPKRFATEGAEELPDTFAQIIDSLHSLGLSRQIDLLFPMLCSLAHVAEWPPVICMIYS